MTRRSASFKEWRTQAACLDADPDIFFQSSTKAAKAICRECPVADECLMYAMDNNETYGVWGGMSPHQRKRMRKDNQ